MAEAQVRFDLQAFDKSRAGFDSFTRNLRQSQATVDQWGRRSNATFDQFSRKLRQSTVEISGMKRVLAGFASGFAASLSLESITRAVKAVADIGDAAKRANVDVGELQKLIFSGQMEGVEGGAIVDAMQKFNSEIGEAKVKGNDLAKILAANNVPLTTATGEIRNTRDLFYEVVDLIANAKSEQEAALIAEIAFGRQARDMLPFLRQGADAIRESGDEAQRVGAILDDEIIASAQHFDDAWTAAIASIKAAIYSEIIGTLRDISGPLIKMDEFLRKYTGKGLTIEPISNYLPDEYSRQEVDRTGKGPFLGNTTDTSGLKREERPLRAKRDSARDEMLREAKRKAAAIKDVIEQLKFETDQLGRNETEQRVYNELKRAGVDINSKAGQEIAALVRHLESEKTAAEAAKEAEQKRLEALEQQGEIVTSNLDRMFDEFTESGKFNVKEMISSMLLDFARLTFHESVSAPLGGLFSKGLGGLLGNLFGGFFADGGRLGAGQIGIVGERGPEFVKAGSQPLDIVPMRGGGASHVTLTTRVVIDGARGNKEIEMMVQKGVDASLPRTLSAVRRVLPGMVGEVQEYGA